MTDKVLVVNEKLEVGEFITYAPNIVIAAAAAAGPDSEHLLEALYKRIETKPRPIKRSIADGALSPVEAGIDVSNLPNINVDQIMISWSSSDLI